jgi:hypothetical protein
MTKLVYLDSSDFSDLSSNAPLSEENRAVLNALRRALDDGSIQLFISAVHISEAVHAAEKDKNDAIRRAELMRDLCGGNVLRFPSELCKEELRKHLLGEASSRLTLDEITSKGDEWFGFHFDEDALNASRTRAQQEISQMINRIPRRERRKHHLKATFSNPRFHQTLRELILAGTPNIVPEFPFSLIDQSFVVDWLLGKRTNAEFRDRLLQIMRDPYVMFKHVIDLTNQRTVLYRLTRDEGAKWSQTIVKIAENVLPLLQIASEIGYKVDLKKKLEVSLREGGFPRHVVTLLAERDVDHLDDTAVDQMISACPAVSVYLETMKAYVFSIIDANLSSIKAGKTSLIGGNESTFGDFMHCIYAPYFDIFRCDAGFGAILKKQKPIRERVADHRSDILKML